MTGVTAMDDTRTSTSKCEMCLTETKYYYHISYSVTTPNSNLAQIKTAELCGDCALGLIEENRVVQR